jgi:hypothetical protein
VTTRKTRSSKQAGPATAATPVAPSAPPPSSAASDLPASPTGSNFDPPSVEDIAAVKAGEKPAAVLFPPRALSEISDFDPPSIEDIKARRDGHGGPITTLYPPGSFSAEEPSATAEEELIDLTEAPSALSARSSVRTGRITKPQANSKGKGKAKAPAEPKPKPKKSLEEQLADFVNPKGSKKGEWNDDWWADLAAVNGNTEAPVNHVKKRSQEMGGKVAATRYG